MAGGESKAKLELEVFLFAPRNLQLKSWSEMELRQDFVSRLRLSAGPSQEINSLLLEWCECLGQLDDPKLVLLTKELGARLSDWFKSHPWMRHLNQDRLSSAEESFREVYSVVVKLRIKMAEVRAEKKRKLRGSPVELLDQYLDHLVANALSELAQKRLEMKKPIEWIEQITREEFQSLQEKGVSFQKLKRNKLEREIHVIRLSQLKKFFQSSLFVDVFKKETLRKFREPVAASAAILAGVTAATVQEMGGQFQMSLQGMALICFGIAVFVIRDRLKDYLRDIFFEKLGDYLPNQHEVLVAGGSRIGEMLEWFHFSDDHQVPDSLKALRKSASLSSAEHFLKDDVFTYKRSITLAPNQAQGSTQVQEILRINLDRHLKFLDDSEKEIRVFTSTGQIESLNSHRSYPLYVGIVSSSAFRKGLKRTRELDVTELFRVMVDKHGIDRVECVGHSH